LITVNNFSNGPVSPVLGYAVSCLGAFLGLSCVTRASYYQGLARARWLAVAATAIGATGIWAMHFIAMLGFAVPWQEISYNVPITIASMLIAIGVVGVGLFIVGFGGGGAPRLLAGGLIVGVGVAAMHYLGMAALVMPDSMSYSGPLLIASVAIAIIAGTTALWIGTWVRGIGATAVASLVMGAAVSGMHYTGMAAMRVHAGRMPGMPAMSGASGDSFLLPLLLGITLVTFALTLAISLSPTEAEIRDDAEFNYRLETLRAHAVPTVPAREEGPAGEERPADGEPAGGYADFVQDHERIPGVRRFAERRARLLRAGGQQRDGSGRVPPGGLGADLEPGRELRGSPPLRRRSRIGLPTGRPRAGRGISRAAGDDARTFPCAGAIWQHGCRAQCRSRCRGTGRRFRCPGERRIDAGIRGHHGQGPELGLRPRHPRAALLRRPCRVHQRAGRPGRHHLRRPGRQR
jgi:NO-binding membrane sensor protein with MHYT domain